MANPLDVSSQELLRSLQEQCESGGSPRPFAPLAEAHRLAGHLDASLSVSRLGVEAFPGHLGIRLVYARALMDTGDSDAALEQYRFVLERDPDNVEAAAHLGAPRHADAGEEPLGPDLASQLSLSSELEHLADLFAAPSGSREAPQDAIATLTLAEIYARQGLADRAVEVCEAMLRRDPNDAEARARLERYRKEVASVT